jgi:hypothetical protein
MDEILQLIRTSNLSANEYYELKEELTILLDKKHAEQVIKSFIQRYNITEDFNIFTNCIDARLSKFFDTGLVYALQIPTCPDPEAGETYIYIYVDKEDQKVIEIEYHTDSYFVYKHSEEETYPNGAFQTRSLENYYHDDIEKRVCIRDHVLEVKKLSALLIKKSDQKILTEN